MADQAFITKRQNDLNEAFNSYNVDKLMSFYTEENLDFTDHGASALHLNHSALRSFYEAMYKACKDLKISSRKVSGTKDFTASQELGSRNMYKVLKSWLAGFKLLQTQLTLMKWEWSITFKYEAKMEGIEMKEFENEGLTVGQEIKMIGVSLTWWGEDEKIKKNADYGKVVEGFEGRESV